MSEAVGRLKLSVIVIAYNMARELPRTLQSLLPPIQQGLAEHEYEIIVVDNGSTQPFDKDQCQSLGSNIIFLSEDNACSSPAAAVNRGIRQASSDLIGVMIDGARMASPGLLKSAVDAAGLHPRAVIGTLAYHLGELVQTQSIKYGYDQQTEDELLASVDWQLDGYRLFEISVFASSSAKGWFCVPSETNALFMSKSIWQELGGYNENFKQPGGGLANLDTWQRACTLPQSQVFILLGEATFHQIHGGVATNTTKSNWQAYSDEYLKIRGKPYQAPQMNGHRIYGSIPPSQAKSILNSAYTLSELAHNQSQKPPTPTAFARPFGSKVPEKILSEIQRGVLKTKYKDVPFLKSPFDIALYLQLLSKQRPQSVIEIGTKHGGSALWFADMLCAAGQANPSIISIDINPVSEIRDERISFLQGDAANLGATLSPKLLQQLPRPLLVIEDSSHYYEHSFACLNFFHDYLQSGDYIVIEDGVVSQLPETHYQCYQNGPNRAVADFLATHGDEYEIDAELCDHYGFNLTYNPNGYLKRL